jgi:curved DNA-binding protein CbpA
LDGTNYYEILEVSHDAPPHEIHKAYQRARATYSADNPALYSMFSPEEARELLRLIEEAYSVLGNNLLRRNYDDALRGGTAPTPGSGAQPVTSTHMPGTSPAHMPAPAPTPSASTIASQHQSLPDFNSPDSAHASPGVPKRPAQEPLAPGMGRTSLSTYKIDETFESEIKANADFDGNFLQKVRLYRNISIDRLSDSTRISRPYLMAVETNDYKALPAAVFVRGFVVQIARALSLDENKVASSYIKLFKAGGGK